MTWPTERPGYPMHAERDGWHWLKHPEDLRPFPSVWNAELRGWPSGGVHSPQGVVDLGFDYLGPCYTQADLDAAVQAEREACIDVLNGHAEYDRRMCCDGRECGCFGTTVHQSIEHYIRARGPTPALDAALAQARAEGMEDAAKIVAASGLNGPGYAAIILAAMAGAPKEYDYRDNTPHDMAAGAAIRSAAAGEEGK